MEIFSNTGIFADHEPTATPKERAVEALKRAKEVMADKPAQEQSEPLNHYEQYKAIRETDKLAAARYWDQHKAEIYKLA